MMAKCEVYLVLSNDEVNARIPYQVICEGRYGSHWNTMHRKRRWLTEFTEEERAAASRLFDMAYTWAMRTGVPDTVRVQPSTLALWLKLGALCASI